MSKFRVKKSLCLLHWCFFPPFFCMMGISYLTLILQSWRFSMMGWDGFDILFGFFIDVFALPLITFLLTTEYSVQRRCPWHYSWIDLLGFYFHLGSLGFSQIGSGFRVDKVCPYEIRAVMRWSCFLDLSIGQSFVCPLKHFDYVGW